MIVRKKDIHSLVYLESIPLILFSAIQDAGLQHVGFFLGSCNISWVLTSESCLRNLPRDDLGHPIQFKGIQLETIIICFHDV